MVLLTAVTAPCPPLPLLCMTFMQGDRKPKSSDVREERFLSPSWSEKGQSVVVEEDYARSSLGCVAEAGGDWFHCLGRKTEGLECSALYGPSDGYIPFPKSFEVSCARYFSAEKIKHRAKPNWERKGLFHLTGYRSSRKAGRGGTWKQELTQGPWSRGALLTGSLLPSLSTWYQDEVHIEGAI